MHAGASDVLGAIVAGGGDAGGAGAALNDGSRFDRGGDAVADAITGATEHATAAHLDTDLGRTYDAQDSGVVASSVAGAGVGAQHARLHRHDMPTNLERGSPVGAIIWALVLLHLVGLAVWLRAWWRQPRTKDPTMRHPTPPTKQSCTYDMDKAFAIPKIELPLKALKFAKA